MDTVVSQIIESKMKEKNQAGFTYIEVMFAIVILTVGILAQLSALSLNMLQQRESEQQNAARQYAASTLESIFAARDLGKDDGLSGWDKINNDTAQGGIFVSGWAPIRQSAGIDGIIGTADDACAANIKCTVGNYTNSSQVMDGFDRQIIITDVQEGSEVIKKRRLEIKIRYFVGQLQREQSVATLIADLPFYK